VTVSGGTHAEFIGEPGRRLFVLLRTPGGVNGECTLVVPPFAEEMNKCRRLVTEYAQHECRQGRGVLCVDLAGTGDSEGEFSAARVDRWLGDLACAAAWSASRGWRVTGALGIRLGAILAASLVVAHKFELSRVLLWQPVTSGARMIDQFLRLRVMAARMESGANETVGALRASLQARETVQVAGYALSGALVSDIDALDLVAALALPFPPIRWFDIVADTNAHVAPGTQRILDSLRAKGLRIEHTQVAGEPFWMATEFVKNPTLVAAS